MTPDRLDDDEVGQRLAQILETEANTIDVDDGWDALTRRLLQSERPEGRLTPASTNRGRLRRLAELTAGVGVAAAMVMVIVLGWPQPVVTPAPVAPVTVAPVTASVPRYDASIPTLVVYRTTGGEDRSLGTPAPGPFTITPQRMRTGSPAIGQAALEAMFDTTPAPGDAPRAAQKLGQADIASVTVSDGLIRIELDSFDSPHYAKPEAHVIAQAWVRTVQDTLGVRDDVSITLHGQPFSLYGVIDTTEPLARDESVRVVRADGFDSPRNGDVVPTTFVLLGSATASSRQPAHVTIVDLATGAIAYDHEVLGSADRAALIDFQPVLTLEPGRYRATVPGYGAAHGAVDITFTIAS